MTPASLPTRTFDIIDAEGNHAGQAPGVNEDSALRAFQADALEGRGELIVEPATARLQVDGETFTAVESYEDKVKGDLENGPHADEVDAEAKLYEALGTLIDAQDGADFNCRESGADYLIVRLTDRESGDDRGLWRVTLTGPATRVDEDTRYTAERIASYDTGELEEHLHERKAQLERARRDMDTAHITLSLIEDPDSELYRKTMANLASATREHAVQKRIVRLLDRTIDQREIDAARTEEADGRRPNVLLLNHEIAQRGLPCGVDESGEIDLAGDMWMQATMALEAEGPTRRPTMGAVAKRVGDAYAVLYGYETVAKWPNTGDAAAARADAAALEAKSGTPIGMEVTKALAICVTDPKIRIHLAPEQLELARVALGVASSDWR